MFKHYVACYFRALIRSKPVCQTLDGNTITAKITQKFFWKKYSSY